MKCKLFFIYLWIVLPETLSTLSPNIYLFISLNGVLSSLLGVVQLDIERLELGFGGFYWGIGKPSNK
jgi:hypothetical protein